MDEATDYYMELQDRREAQSTAFDRLRDEEIYPVVHAQQAQRNMMDIMADLEDSSSRSGSNLSQLRDISESVMPTDYGLLRSIASGTRCRPEKTTFTYGKPLDVIKAERKIKADKRAQNLRSIKKKKKKKT